MKTIRFDLDNCIEKPGQFDVPIAKYRVPTLPAYAIEFAVLKTPQQMFESYQRELTEGRGFHIEGDIVVVSSYTPDFLVEAKPPILLVHYHGIRDYRLLFPAVTTAERKQSLANYYEEAEKCFEAGAWLSFMLMCGAVFEGLLFDRLGMASLNKFVDLIAKAQASKVITADEATLFDTVRRYRNIVHLNQADKASVSRAEVMDTRKTLDVIVTRLSYPATTV
jgi:hypothetical protein